MTADELAGWRAKSARLRELVIAMEPGETRAAAAFAAGAMLGLANRLHALELLKAPALCTLCDQPLTDHAKDCPARIVDKLLKGDLTP